MVLALYIGLDKVEKRSELPVVSTGRKRGWIKVKPLLSSPFFTHFSLKMFARLAVTLQVLH